MAVGASESLDRLSKARGFAVDLDGTVYLGERLLPGARDLVQALRRRGIPFVFLTNNSSRSTDEYVQKLGRLGLDVGPENVLTSGAATIAFLKRRYDGKGVFLVGTPSLAREFGDGGIELVHASEADVAVLGFDTTVTYRKLQDLCVLVRQGRPYIATHPDVLCPTDGEPLVDIGAFVELVRAATGRVPDVVVGKPNPMMVSAIAEKLGARADELVSVGDRLYTDVRMAVENGMTSVLVLSGETDVSMLSQARWRPHLVVRDLAELVQWLERAWDPCPATC